MKSEMNEIFFGKTENSTAYKMKGIPLSFSFARFFWFVSRNLVFLLHLFLVCWDTSNFSACRIFAAFGLFSFFSLSVGSGLVRSVLCIEIQDIPRLHLEEQLFLYFGRETLSLLVRFTHFHTLQILFTSNFIFSFKYLGLLHLALFFFSSNGNLSAVPFHFEFKILPYFFPWFPPE